MKLCLMSDQHGYLPVIPDCDVLIIAGDLSLTNKNDIEAQYDYLMGPFRRWLDGIVARNIKIIATSGNHDSLLEQKPWFVDDLPWEYLEENDYAYGGLTFHGTPWTPTFYDWAFNADEDELERIFADIPIGIDGCCQRRSDACRFYSVSVPRD